MLQYQIRKTNNLHIMLHNLLHFSLYSVSIVACQAPIVYGNMSVKLCSLHPAETAAYTKPSGRGPLFEIQWGRKGRGH